MIRRFEDCGVGVHGAVPHAVRAIAKARAQLPILSVRFFPFSEGTPATTLNLRYGWKYGLPAYAIATLVGEGRIQANRHHLKDVLAGATIGSISAWIFTDSFAENVQVVAWADRHEAGLTVAINW